MAGGLLGFFATGADAPRLADPARVDAIFRSQRWRVMTAITLGYGLTYAGRLALGVVKKPLIDQGIFTPSELGLIGSALFYAYAIGKLTNGFLADHANPRRFLTAAFALSAVCTAAMGMTTTLWLAVIIWGLNGWFQSFGAPGCVVAMTSWFSNRERGRAYGLWNTSHSIGEGITFFAVGTLVALAGWRWGFFGPAMLSLATAAAAFVLLRDRPQTMGLPSVADWNNDHYAIQPAADGTPVWRQQFAILKIPALWILAVASAANYVTRYAINSWGVLYLQEEHGMSLPTAGFLLMLSTLAGIAGSIAYGLISDKVFAARRPPANLLFAVVEIIGLLLIFFGPDNLAVLVTGMVLFGLGLTGLVASLGGLFAVDIAPKRVAGAAMGVIGVFSYIGAAIQENVSGALIEQGMTMVGDDRVYDFGPAIAFWIGASVLSLLLAASLWRAKLRD